MKYIKLLYFLIFFMFTINNITFIQQNNISKYKQNISHFLDTFITTQNQKSNQQETNHNINNSYQSNKKNIVAHTSNNTPINNHPFSNKTKKRNTKILKSNTPITIANHTFKNKLYNQQLEKYTDEIEHLSFNTLIAFPDKIFNSKNNRSFIYDQEKITAHEFKNIISELYAHNYILISPKQLFTLTDNKLIQNDIYIPQGKKPIILSFNNVTYKSNYQNLGEIDKIIIDRNNNIATYSNKKSIQDRINYENEFIVILEKFIKNNQDFSFNNARGIIFFTGENGILGYNTTHKNASHKSERKKASQVIQALQSLGWEFGSNNYRYIDYTTRSDFEFANDLSLWNNEIKPLIDHTPYFAYPYGNYIKENQFRQDLLTSSNFNISFYTNNNSCNININNNLCFMSRREINGNTLRQNNYSHLFDSNKVYDHQSRIIPLET